MNKRERQNRDVRTLLSSPIFQSIPSDVNKATSGSNTGWVPVLRKNRHHHGYCCGKNTRSYSCHRIFLTCIVMGCCIYQPLSNISWMKTMTESTVPAELEINTNKLIYNLHNHNQTIDEPTRTTTMLPSSSATMKEINFDGQNNNNNGDTKIRSWGCHLTQTPLIFVHIGKAGGGHIRARFAAAAWNITRDPRDWRRHDLDDSYYPINISNNQHNRHHQYGHNESHNKLTMTSKAYFCNDMYRQHRIPTSREFLGKKYETSVVYCQATTPLGIAIACPEPAQHMCRGCNDMSSSTCNTVYVGHVSIGNELHWLPSTMLREWFQSTSWHYDDDEKKSTSFRQHTEQIMKGLDTLRLGNLNWCPGGDEKKKKEDERHQNMFQKIMQRVKQKYDEREQQQYIQLSNLANKRTDTSTSASTEKVLDYDTVQSWSSRQYYDCKTWEDKMFLFDTCSKPWSDMIDPLVDELLFNSVDDADTSRTYTQQTFHGRFGDGSSSSILSEQMNAMTKNYGPLYASMPVQRVVMLREPFDYLLSRFFWTYNNKIHNHNNNDKININNKLINEGNFQCDDLQYASIHPHRPHEQQHEGNRRHSNDSNNKNNNNNSRYGWAVKASYQYIFPICGEDCIIRYEMGVMTLQEMEEQAIYNLRNSFSVVGILEHETKNKKEEMIERTITTSAAATGNDAASTNMTTTINDIFPTGQETQQPQQKKKQISRMTFFEMISKRFEYMDMSLHPEIIGNSHTTMYTKEAKTCKQLFQNQQRRMVWLQHIPELDVMQKLYHVGIEVNKFQQNELMKC